MIISLMPIAIVATPQYNTHETEETAKYKINFFPIKIIRITDWNTLLFLIGVTIIINELIVSLSFLRQNSKRACLSMKHITSFIEVNFIQTVHKSFQGEIIKS